MKLCSACLRELDKEAFSAKQWKLNQHQRRCKNCVDGGRESQIERPDVAESGEYLPKFPLTDEAVKKAIKDLIDNAVKMIMKRGIPPNVGLDGFNEKKLAKRLWKVANNNFTIGFFHPFLLGLASGSRNHINKKIKWRGDSPTPILSWLCQYRFFEVQFDYQGRDDMVALALSAGASVNALNPANGITPIFFSMKYSSLRTVEMLLEQGATVNLRDVYGQTIWKNAVEFPNIEILDFLLRRCCDDIPVARERIKISDQFSGKSYPFTLPDHMLGLYMGMLPSRSNPDLWAPVSWRVMGYPDDEVLGTALLRVMQAGATLSGSTAAQKSFSALPVDPLSFVTHIDSVRLQNSEILDQRAPTGRFLADVIYGRRLPAIVRAEVLEKEHSPHILDSACPICLADMDERNQPITLYCGHRFCTVCIRSFGQATLSVEREMTDKRCPLCRRLLCGDLLSEDFKRKYRSGQIRFGVDRYEATDSLLLERGPHLLTDDQLKFECTRMLKRADGSREELLKSLFDTMEKSLKFDSGDTVMTFSGGKKQSLNTTDIRFEPAATNSMFGASGYCIYAPGIGPVFVPIQVKNVPVLAGLSTQSFFTIIPQSVVDNFQLKTKPIRSSRFITLFGEKAEVLAVVDEFKFTLGSVDVCLNNAIVLATMNHNEHIQLGLDFMESAAWVRCSTTLGAEGSFFVVTDGGYTKDLYFAEDQPDELRYYSRDGKTATIPLIHVENLSGSAHMPIVSLPADILSTSFPECQWCCRCFPSDSLLHHNGRYYCDEECLTNGLKIRPD